METMKIVLIRRQEDSGQKPLDAKVLAFRAQSFVKHMDALGIEPDKYNDVYEIAVSIYNDKEVKGPFGVDFMVQAAKSLQEAKVVSTIYKKNESPKLVSCTSCQGSKISYKWVGKNIVGINRNYDGSIKKCEDCCES
jgi:DNA polymerase IIIc chi subunit